jgi:glycerate kinase
MRGKILIAALPIPGIWDATDAASQLARMIRTEDRSLTSADLVQLPVVDGGTGTIDFLVSHTLGSFLEVEACGAAGVDLVVPIGFAGEDGKLAVIEMSRVAGVPHLSDSGTTAGIGELIQDALDEGAFSVILGHEEPIARDAGLGAAAAIGVRFFDDASQEINFTRPGTNISSIDLISNIAKVDASSRSFALLSSRIFIARASNAEPMDTMLEDKDSLHVHPLHAVLEKLADIIHRDIGIRASTARLSPSAVEFGLTAFLGAEVREGASLVFEASNISENLTRGEFSEMIFMTPSLAAIENHSIAPMLALAREKVKHRAILVAGGNEVSSEVPEPVSFLQDVALFQPPVTETSGLEAKRRDIAMRLEKVIPSVLEELRKKTTSKSTMSKGSRV